MEVNKRIVLWCGPAANHRALANKLHARFGLAGIVIDAKTKKQGRKEKLFQKLIDALHFRKIYAAWESLQQQYNRRFPAWPDVPTLEVDTINSEAAKAFTEDLAPHLIAVSGTGLVKESLLNVAVNIGIINLHTGLSPYVKGGPNCTNWCIATNQWHLVGNTIMWINGGIDTGNIIVNEAIDVRCCKSLAGVQLNVMEHAHDLYLRAIDYLLSNTPPYNSVPQEQLGKGQLFLTKMWTAEKRIRLLHNWKHRKKATLAPVPETVPLPA